VLLDWLANCTPLDDARLRCGTSDTLARAPPDSDMTLRGGIRGGGARPSDAPLPVVAVLLLLLPLLAILLLVQVDDGAGADVVCVASGGDDANGALCACEADGDGVGRPGRGGRLGSAAEELSLLLLLVDCTVKAGADVETPRPHPRPAPPPPPPPPAAVLIGFVGIATPTGGVAGSFRPANEDDECAAAARDSAGAGRLPDGGRPPRPVALGSMVSAQSAAAAAGGSSTIRYEQVAECFAVDGVGDE
jgi:hypothetical protein